MPNVVETPLEALPLMDLLRELALDLGFEWNRYNDDIWRSIDPEVWMITRNPWLMLQQASPRELKAMTEDANLRHRVEQLVKERRERSQSSHWFDKTHAGAALKQVAYFSMEFGLSEALPIYSGGLGNVAGDQLKTGDDLGVPIVGIGLLYQQGYSRQAIDHDGHQRDLFPYNPPNWLPISRVRDNDGEFLSVGLDFPDYYLRLRVWEAKVGRLKLYLLDSNDPANIPMMRGITSELYGGNTELRLQQEAVLGIGGWRLLSALGHTPEVCHLNEGHAAFAVIERALSFMREYKVPFGVALTATRPGNLFTTHTPVAAGFDRFSPALMNLYLGHYAAEQLRISFQELMALGRADAKDPNEPFNMAYLAIRGAGAVNGVSQLHGEVSRSIFQPLFPRWPADEVPIASVTNGVHVVTWESEFAGRLWTDACGEDRWHTATDEIGGKIRAVSDEKLWELRSNNAQELVRFVRLRAEHQRAAYGASPDVLQSAKTMFNPNALTLGFARRFATYKRPNLLLRDPDRLARILTNRQYPVQLVVAGKAHPQDQAGKDMLQQWVQFIRRTDIHEHAIFLVDYDLLLAQRIVQGVDVWINNPRRPWEACGTSGMKVLVNGGLNLSVLDGWWAEAYAGEVGWSLGDGKEHEDDTSTWDALDARQLFDILENEVIPKFYRRDEHGLPREWIVMKRESMARLTPQFSANRAVREYTEKYYLPAATRFRERETSQASRAKAIELWRDSIAENWTKLNFGVVRVETVGDFHELRVQVYLGELQPDAVAVELYAGAQNGGLSSRHRMTPVERLIGTVGGFLYAAQVPSNRPSNDYTPRIIPATEGVSVPLEEPRILWQR
jgi:glycogen phosphorylase